MDLEIGLSLTISWTKSSVLQFYGFWPWPVGLCYLLRTSRIFFSLFLSDIKFQLGSLSPFEFGKYRNNLPFGTAFQMVFHQILFYFFIKIECDLYVLDRFDVLISKIIF